MRIAFVVHQFFPRYYTGVERLTLNLARQLQRMGHACVVLAPSGHAGDGPDAYAVGGVRVRPVAAPRVDLARPWLRGDERGAAVRRALEAEAPEVVHVMHPMRLPQVFDEAAALGLPLVAHVADFYYLCARVDMRRRDGSLCASAEDGAACSSACGVAAGPDRVAWGREALAGAAAVVCPSRFAIDLHARNGFATHDWHHVPWGVDYALVGPRVARRESGRLVVGFLGTLLEHKGPHVAVEAVRSLARDDVELRLYGGSFHEQAYERRLRRLAGDDARIVFAGAYDHDDLPRLLSELDAVVIPSLWHENLPTVGLLAAAAGVPVIGSAVGGVLELLDEYRCGVAFPPGDVPRLASCLGDLLDDAGPLVAGRHVSARPPSLEEHALRVEALAA